MTNEEREDLNTFKHDLVKQARWWQWKAETLEKENEQLKAENAALCEQISEMVMPPCTLGDTLYIVACTFGDGYVEDEIVHQGGFSVVKSVVTEKNFYKMCDLVRNEKAFFSREFAEARLAELKGEKKNG